MMCSPDVHSQTKENSCITVATPPEFPSGIPGIWSPEHLFTAAISTCFMTTFLSIAENYKLDFRSFKCSAKGKLDTVNGKPLMTEVILEPCIKIHEASSLPLASKVLAKTEAACLISNSVKATVKMIPLVTFVSEEKEKLTAQ